MTPNPHLPRSSEKFVLWLSKESGEERKGDTLAHALNLANPTLGIVVDRIEVRFTVEVPDEEVMEWDDYAKANGVSSSEIRRVAKWPLKSDLWVPFQRQIPASEWIEIGVGRDTWAPMFTPDGTVSEEE